MASFQKALDCWEIFVRRWDTAEDAQESRRRNSGKFLCVCKIKNLQLQIVESENVLYPDTPGTLNRVQPSERLSSSVDRRYIVGTSLGSGPATRPNTRPAARPSTRLLSVSLNKRPVFLHFWKAPTAFVTKPVQQPILKLFKLRRS